MLSEYAQIVLSLFLGGSLLVFARRFHNNANRTGEAVAAWTMILIVIVVLKFLFPNIIIK